MIECYYYNRRKLPPGPSPFPIFGYKSLFAKGTNPEDAYIEWRKQYGDIFTIWNPKPTVVIAGYDKIVETFQKDGDAYAGRPSEFANSKLYIMTRGEPRGGVVLTEGDLWRDHRRFALHVLRDFGLGKDLMQERVLDEVFALLSKITADIKAGHQEHNLPARLDVAVGSIINSLLFGYRFDHGHEKEFFELKALVAQEIRFAGHRTFHLLNKYPTVISRLPFGKQMFEQLCHARRQLFDFYQRQIDEHIKGIDFETDAQPTDYAEAYLREKKKLDDEGREHNFTMSQLKGMCSDLFVAGQETTATTLAWGVAYLIHSPDVQRRLHVEPDRVICSDRLVTMADRPKLHFTNAVINETQRLCNLLPQNVPRKTTRDVTIDGYLIPKGTTIVPQISAVLYDEKIFPEPKKFNPDRFLDSSGHLKRCDELIPFSIGKRQCLGEGLARMELFLFLANLFNRFKMSSGDSLLSLQRIRAGTAQCPGYACHVEKRHT